MVGWFLCRVIASVIRQFYNEQIHSSGAQVENQYQRKADLIPNLMATAKGFSVPCKDWQKKVPFKGVFKMGISKTATKQKKVFKADQKGFRRELNYLPANRSNVFGLILVDADNAHRYLDKSLVVELIQL